MNHAKPEKLRGAYLSAAMAFERAEAVLSRALDALDAARAGVCPSSITRTRIAASDADKAAGTAWEVAEAARRDYWRKRAADMEERLAAEFVPLLVQLAAFQRFACLPAIPAEHLLRHHLIAPQAYIAPDEGVSVDPLASPQLERADNDI
ncbi:MAG: hypothetical protein ACYCWC_12605 [Rhodocyclaceae bacterium]